MFGAIDVGLLVDFLHKQGYRKQLEFDFPPVVYIRPELVCDVALGHSFNDSGWVSHQDHPAFTELRNDLEKRGYIKTQRSWSNGDVVLKPFYLNEIYFDKGKQFPCAAAMKFHLENGKFRHLPVREYESEEPTYENTNQLSLF